MGRLYFVIAAIAVTLAFGHDLPSQARQQEPSPNANPSFPGEPPEYADGVYCSPVGDIFNGVQTPDHPCACKRVDRASDCETQHTTTNECAQYCHDKHCSCPVKCEPAPPGDPTIEDGTDPTQQTRLETHGDLMCRRSN